MLLHLPLSTEGQACPEPGLKKTSEVKSGLSGQGECDGRAAPEQRQGRTGAASAWVAANPVFLTPNLPHEFSVVALGGVAEEEYVS